MSAKAADRDVTNVVIHVDDAYQPYSYRDEKGMAKGIYIDILNVAFSRMPGFKVTMEPVPWKRGKMMMEKGEGFGLAPAFYHGHDWPYLYPYSLPFAHETIISVCHAQQLVKPRSNWPGDYLGLRVGNVEGFDGWGGNEFYELVRQGKIHYEEAKGSVENIMKLGMGRVECIMMEENAFDLEYASLKKSGDYDANKFHSLKKAAFIGQDPVYIGYSKKAIESGKYPFHMAFRQAFDSEIYKMNRSGEIKQLLEKLSQ
jgi:polar amino acid transport system substrate-binding protein